MPLIILGGIYRGIFTPTEAAAVACVYAFVVSKFVYKELEYKDLSGLRNRSHSQCGYPYEERRRLRKNGRRFICSRKGSSCR
ncbi:TRAP transporter large permease subunit [Acetomicrobium mobile]|uniref:TRAP transporter large permease subunit n=1 Tax=Acetomicrobium mobile TaxID=97477 RepID=UPI00350E3900